MKKIGCIFLLGFLLLSGCSSQKTKVQEENIDPNSILDEVIAELDGCKSYVETQIDEGNRLEAKLPNTIPETVSDLKVSEGGRSEWEIEILNVGEKEYWFSSSIEADSYSVEINYPEEGMELVSFEKSEEGLKYWGDSYIESPYTSMRSTQKMISELKENKFYESKGEKIGDNIIITFSLKDVEGYNKQRIEEYETQGANVLFNAGVITSKNEVTKSDYIFTINKDHQLIQYEEYNTHDYGDGLETWRKSVYKIERKDVDLDAKKIDAIIEKAKSGALKDGDLVDW